MYKMTHPNDIRVTYHCKAWRNANNWHYRFHALQLSGMPQDKIFRVMANLAKLGVQITRTIETDYVSRIQRHKFYYRLFKIKTLAIPRQRVIHKMTRKSYLAIAK